MTDHPRFQDEFEGLDEEEARELTEVVQALKSDQFKPADDGYWATLNQRIVNELAVTRPPRRRAYRGAELVAHIRDWAKDAAHQPVKWRIDWAVVMLVAAALGFYVMTNILDPKSPEPTGPGLEPAEQTLATLPAEGTPAALPAERALAALPAEESWVSPSARTLVKPMVLSEDLWSGGFLAQRGLFSGLSGSIEETDPAEESDDSSPLLAWLMDESDGADTASEVWYYVDLEGDLTLEDLSQQELTQLEQLLDG